MCAGCGKTIRAVQCHCHTCAKDWCRKCTDPEERRVTITRCQKSRSHIECQSCGHSKGLTIVMLTYTTMAPDPAASCIPAADEKSSHYEPACTHQEDILSATVIRQCYVPSMLTKGHGSRYLLSG
ncbi:unnamed protein product [Ectocarpus sp. 6 AP-2014]